MQELRSTEMKKSLAILPLRAGSKSIKGKNKKKLLGRPLYQWILGEAIFSKLDKIIVFTDDLEIIDQVEKNYEWTQKVEVIRRSDNNANDNASSESAMIELTHMIDIEEYYTYTLLQATSPLTLRTNINDCINNVLSGKNESSLTVVNTKRFIWSINGNSLNYDFNSRPRRQDFDGIYIENGAVYTTLMKNFKSTGNRISGKIGLTVMPEDTLIEIDEENDWIICEQLLINRLKQIKSVKAPIKFLVIDVDGVLTNSTVAVTENGELFKSFSLRDGMGFELLNENDITPIILTSEDSDIVKTRIKKIGVQNAFFGIKDKYAYLQYFLLRNNQDLSCVAYIGDDLNDLSNMCSVSWSFCPLDATEQIKQISDIILHRKGGEKCVREVIEFIININNRLK